jgi:nuclear GTP-binding protein
MKRIYLIDCPGVVPPSSTDTPQDILLKGVVRVENVENPEQYIPAVLMKTKPQHIERTYALKGYKNHIEFLELLARKAGRLLAGGECDVNGVAKMVINDFLRGKIPWFTPPPLLEGQEEMKGVQGRLGKLGEMGLKRKREDAESTVADASVADISMADGEEEDDDEFEGFDSDAGVDLSDDGMPDSDSEVEGGAELEDEDEEEAEEDDEDASDLAIQEQIRETLKSNPSTKDTVRIPTPKKRRTKT